MDTKNWPLAAMLALVAPAAHAGFIVTAEAPGVMQPGPAARCGPDCLFGTETFDSRTIGVGHSFTSDFGTGGRITGHYGNADIRAANQYGGAGGGGRYVETFSDRGIDLRLATRINYFGLWLSALDRGNLIEFYRGDSLRYSFGPAEFAASAGGCPGPYCGNPAAPFARRNPSEPYAYMHFLDSAGGFDRIRFAQTPGGGGFESDNHAVGSVRGSDAAPAPATLLLLPIGLAAIGLRRR